MSPIEPKKRLLYSGKRDTDGLFTQEHLDYLRRVYPDCRPQLGESERRIFHSVGQQTVIDHIEALIQRSEKF